MQRAPNAPDIAEIKKQIGQIETLAAARAAETPAPRLRRRIAPPSSNVFNRHPKRLRARELI